MSVQHPDMTPIVRLKGDNQLVWIEALGIDELAERGEEVIHNEFASRSGRR